MPRCSGQEGRFSSVLGLALHVFGIRNHPVMVPTDDDTLYRNSSKKQRGPMAVLASNTWPFSGSYSSGLLQERFQKLLSLFEPVFCLRVIPELAFSECPSLLAQVGMLRVLVDMSAATLVQRSLCARALEAQNSWTRSSTSCDCCKEKLQRPPLQVAQGRCHRHPEWPRQPNPT